MNHQFTTEDRERIKHGIQQKYAKVAASPKGNFRYPTGRAGLEGQGYDSEIVKAFPEDVLAAFCGVGNPFALGPINEGDAVLDVGCGAGVDTLIAAMMVGPAGRVVGIDLVPEMLERSKKNLSQTFLQNVEFLECSAEGLIFPDDSFDAVISNGVINLIPDKAKALREIFRVLKFNGRLMIADQVLTGEPPGDTKSMVDKWAG
jgi:SAM-dependent methyltransferase